MKITKALTFRASSIGDCLMAKYLLDNVHAEFPEARLGIVIASRGGMIRDLLANAPYIEVIETNRRDIRGLFRLWRHFHGSELVVTQYAGKHGGRFGMASKLAARVLARRGGLVGFKDASRWNTFLYDHLLPVRPDHAVAEHEREALRAAGLSVLVPYPQLRVTAQPAVLERFSLQSGRYIVAHFFAGNAGRSISPQKARELIEHLRARFPETTIVLSGGAADQATTQTMLDGVSNSVTVAGSASLQDMLQLINSSIGVVSVDTGIAHITAQIGRPLVVMRTCLGPNWWFPEQYGARAAQQFTREDLCTPHVSKNYPDCIDKIDMRAVADACKNSFVQRTSVR